MYSLLIYLFLVLIIIVSTSLRTSFLESGNVVQRAISFYQRQKRSQITRHTHIRQGTVYTYPRISRIDKIFAQNGPKFIFLRLNIIKVYGFKRLFFKFSSFWIKNFLTRVYVELKKYWPNFAKISRLIREYMRYFKIFQFIIFIFAIR